MGLFVPLCRLSKPPTPTGAMDSGAPPRETPSATEADDLHDCSLSNVCSTASTCDDTSEHPELRQDDRPPCRRIPPDEAAANVAAGLIANAAIDHINSTTSNAPAFCALGTGSCQ